MTTKYVKCCVSSENHYIKDLLESFHITFLYTKSDKEIDTNIVENSIRQKYKQLSEVPQKFTYVGIDYFGKEKNLIVLKFQASEEFKNFRLAVFKDCSDHDDGLISQNFIDYHPHITIGKRGEVDESSIIIPTEPLIVTGLKGSRDEFIVEF